MKGTIMTGLTAKRHVDINRTRTNHQSSFATNNKTADDSNKKPHTSKMAGFLSRSKRGDPKFLIIPKTLLEVENLLLDTLGFHKEILRVVRIVFDTKILHVGFFVDVG
jgi:hypothetical protein